MVKVTRTEYTVVTGTVDRMRGDVNDRIYHGWIPCGGISYAGIREVSVDGFMKGNHEMAQAMTRKLGLVEWVRKTISRRWLLAQCRSAERQRRRGDLR